ncbi:MAG TPA: lyase family protein, partial [Rudaea sp.]|nr:lyase family protein [Rudaea sp.]
MQPSPLTALSPLDGRYAAKVEALRPIFSEFGLMQRRVRVEIQWLVALAGEKAIAEVGALSAGTRQFLTTLADAFSLQDAERIKAIEATTNHDVKAVEYFIKEKIGQEKTKIG